MLSSQGRILATHTGSLPRPAALTEMYAARAAGESVDEAMLEAAEKAVTRNVVRRQLAAGIDVGNNGEQLREAFFLYVRRRMSGFGGSWVRPPMADTVRYPGFQGWAAEHEGARRCVSNRGALPTAVAAVEYLDPALVRAEIDDFRDALAEVGSFAEDPVICLCDHASSPVGNPPGPSRHFVTH